MFLIDLITGWVIKFLIHQMTEICIMQNYALICVQDLLKFTRISANLGQISKSNFTYLLTLAYFGTICPGMDQVMMSQHHRLVALYVG